MRKSHAPCSILASVPRPSPVTDEVRRLFEKGARHAWSIDEMHQAVLVQLGSADYSSIFRAVTLLERDGLLDRIDLGDGRAHYELRDSHHEHIRCESCGRVDEVPGCLLDDVTAQVQKATQFRVTSHSVVFAGICGDCAEKPLVAR